MLNLHVTFHVIVKQVDNVKYAAKHKLEAFSTCYKNDTLAYVMQMSQSSSDDDTVFVRSVTTERFP